MHLPSPIPLVSLDDIMTHNLPPIDWLVTDLIANQDRVVVYGEFGSLKSWLLLDLALAIASGQMWLGQFPVPQPRKVLYVDEEMNERTLRRRVMQLSLGTLAETTDLPFRAMSLCGVSIKSGDDVETLLKGLVSSGFDPDVIILETLRRVMVGSELDAQDVGEFWRSLRPLQQAGKTVIISHHMRKPSARGGNAVRDRASGSTDILGGADAAFAVTRKEHGRVVLECVKNRNAPELQVLAASLVDGHEGACRWQFGGFQAGASIQTQLLQVQDKIIEYLKEKSPYYLKPGEIQKFILSQGIEKRTYERAWRQVKKSGKVEQQGSAWRLKVDVPQAA